MRNVLHIGVLLMVIVSLLASWACEAAPKFEVIELDVAPPEVPPGHAAIITAQIKNSGGSNGVYDAVLSVNGVDIDSKEVTLAPGDIQKIEFSLVKDEPGIYKIAIGELTSSLMVNKHLVAKEVEFKYDDGIARDHLSAVPGGGYLIDFTPPEDGLKIESVRIYGALLGSGWGDESTFEVAILDKDLNVLHSARYPVTMFDIGNPEWREFGIDSTEVTDRFYVYIYTGTGRLQGIHIGVDDSVVNRHSDVALSVPEAISPDKWPWSERYTSNMWFSDKSKVNWMIRVVGTHFVPEQKEKVVVSCSHNSSPAQIIYYGSDAKAWKRIPNVTISAVPDDPRIQLVYEAIDFWNEQLAEIGTPFRFGTVTVTTELIPDDSLVKYSAAILEGKPLPSEPAVLTAMTGDIIIALSDAFFISFSEYPKTGKTLIAIQNCSVSPMNLTNVPRNVIAHELGHAIGLGHNNDPTKLMCGRPADCRPPDFYCEIEMFFPLTEEEKSSLLRLYPTTWEPSK